jgi:hypothetical protein
MRVLSHDGWRLGFVDECRGEFARLVDAELGVVSSAISCTWIGRGDSRPRREILSVLWSMVCISWAAPRRLWLTLLGGSGSTVACEKVG